MWIRHHTTSTCSTSCFALTSLSGHVNKTPVSVILKQEVGAVLIIAEHIGPGTAQDGSDHDAPPTCTWRKRSRKLPHAPRQYKNWVVSGKQLLTRQLADPNLGGHIGQSDDTPGHVTGSLVHLQEGVRADVTAGIVGHVYGVSAGSLHSESRFWVRWRKGKDFKDFKKWIRNDLH